MKKNILLFAFFLLSSLIFFSLTNPEKLPVGVLMVPILLVFGLASTFMYLVISVWQGRSKDPRTTRSIAILSGITASMIILFQSTGGIIWADIILMGLLLIVAYLYIHRY